MSLPLAAARKANKKTADGLPEWTDEDINNSRASCNAQDGDEDRAFMEAFNGSSRVPVPQKTIGLQQNLASFWRKSKDGFSKMWLDLLPDQKIKLLRTISPYMPESEANPVVDGTVMHGVLALAPEMTLCNLTYNNGRKLLELMEHRATHDMFDIMWSSRVYIDGALQRKKLRRDRKKSNEFAYFYGDEAGQTVVPKNAQGLRKLREFAEQGFLWPSEEYFLCMERENVIISTFCLLAHEYNITWKGKTQSRLLTAAAGCFNCAATNQPDGRALMECKACRRAYYCTKECQKGHWKQHKAPCQEISNRRKEREEEQKKAKAAAQEGVAATAIAEGEVGGKGAVVSQDDGASADAPADGSKEGGKSATYEALALNHCSKTIGGVDKIRVKVTEVYKEDVISSNM